MPTLLESNLLQPSDLICIALLLPAVAAILIALVGRWRNVREAVTLVAASGVAWCVWSLLPVVLAGGRPTLNTGTVITGIDFAFQIEPLGMIFALVAGTLWLINSIYSIGYMRGNKETRQTQFYVCFAIAIAATMGIAFSENLFTLFICYEVLTLSTYPLVTHKATPEAMRGGRVYLLILLATSMVLLLPAIIATYQIAGTLSFQSGGILAGRAGDTVIGILLALYIFGIGKAAVMPFHSWLPNAMVAPTPVSALLHAVAVVKAGVFTVLKVVIFVFGLDTVSGNAMQPVLIGVAMITLVAASLVAVAKDNLKARLAYSTVSQLAYIVLGSLIATSLTATGAGLHIATHAAGKITLFFCAGAIYVAHKKTLVSELDGIGRQMPLTMTAFLIASMSIIGLPPLGGLWSKWLLIQGALSVEMWTAVVVLMLSTLLSVAYLMPIAARAFFRPLPGQPEAMPVQRQEAPWPCVLALTITALLAVLLFFTSDALVTLIESVVTETTTEKVDV